MIRLSKVAFIHEVPNPASMSLEPGNWLRLFAAPQYAIAHDGDAVRITHVESGRAVLYPWANVAGAVLEAEAKRESRPELAGPVSDELQGVRPGTPVRVQLNSENMPRREPAPLPLPPPAPPLGQAKKRR